MNNKTESLNEIFLKEAKNYFGCKRDDIFQSYVEKITRNSKCNIEKEITIFKLKKIIWPNNERTT